MKFSRHLLFLLLIFSGVAHAETPSATTNEMMSQYPLGAGDTISIAVYREPDLTFETRLTDAGTIIFPFLGEISVAGLTVGQLKEKITQGLAGRYLIDPKVSVSIVNYREFFVNGEVKKPGAYPYAPGLTAQKAISMAGGFSDRASQSEVLIIREKDPSHTPVEAEIGANVSPGDVVIVEESFF